MCLAAELVGQAPAPPTNVRLVWDEPFSVGPRSSISCPAGAVAISPGTDIQTVVSGHAGGTVFCLRAGIHYLARAITPKSGNIFVGEYGAVLDGSRWSTTDVNQAAFRAQSQDVDDVTIRNLVIRNMPQKGIHASADASDRWTIEYNEIAGNRTGVAAPSRSVVRNNYIHHNTSGGYSAYRAASPVFEGNEIAYNGGEQKLVGTTNGVFRNNLVHHNTTDGIWYDADNTGGLIEGNIVEDNGRVGIFYEISAQGVIRDNIVRRSGDTAIFISTSKSVETYRNTLEDNFRGIQYFLNCAAVGGGAIGWDLADNMTYDNTVKVGTRSGSLANMLGYAGSTCTSTQVAPYLSGSKNLRFERNSYIVPSLTVRYWVWGLGSLRSWAEWQTLGHDDTGVVQ